LLQSHDIKSLNIPEALIDLLLKHSLSRERILEMTPDELASLLGIDLDCPRFSKSAEELE